MKGKYFLDKIDKIVYSTDNYILWNFYISIFYGKPFPGEIDDIILGEPVDWDVVTFNGKILKKKVKGKYVEVA